jgi:hypothetical protein
VTPQRREERRRIGEERRKRFRDGDELGDETWVEEEREGETRVKTVRSTIAVPFDVLTTHFDLSKPRAWCLPPL